MTRPPITHDIRLTDTTLRDGSHAMSHQFTVEQVRDTVRALDAAGVEVIEVAHGDGLGGSSFNYGFSRTEEIELIATARAAASRARIAALLVPGIGTVKDLQRAHDDNPIFHGVATLSVLDGMRALRLKLWDEDGGRLVTFGQARAGARAAMSARLT